MYKIIACDLDETLLSDDRTISKENIEAIQKPLLKIKEVSYFILKEFLLKKRVNFIKEV